MTSLKDLHTANITRQAEWCPDQVPDLSFRGNELAGEAGEAAEALILHAAELGKVAGGASNIVKKLERERYGWRGSRATLDDLAQELADVVICADLCAVTAGIDLGAAVVAKFNATSEKVGLTTRLTPAADGWQPIATAPKGDMLWLFEPHAMGGFQFCGCRTGDDTMWVNNLDGIEQHPTHWMPMPASPPVVLAPADALDIAGAA